MGTSQRSNFVGTGNPTPGPGQFNTSDWDTHSRVGAGSRFGPSDGKYKAGDRGKDLVKNIDNPGPGAYTLGRNSCNAPSYSMAGSKYDKDLSDAPGPGKYQPNFSNKGDDRASLIGTGQRSSISVGKKGPGPGAYNVHGTGVSLTYSIGNSVRKAARADKVPGPGQYHVPYYVAEVPRYQMPNKSDEWRFV